MKKQNIYGLFMIAGLSALNIMMIGKMSGNHEEENSTKSFITSEVYGLPASEALKPIQYYVIKTIDEESCLYIRILNAKKQYQI